MFIGKSCFWLVGVALFIAYVAILLIICVELGCPLFKGQLPSNFTSTKFTFNVQYVPPNQWGTGGSPVKRLLNQLVAFKKAPPQTTLHLPADCVNSHDTPVTLQLTVASSSGQPCS